MVNVHLLINITHFPVPKKPCFADRNTGEEITHYNLSLCNIT